MRDANAAFNKSDFATALPLYRQAASDDSTIPATAAHRVPPAPELRAFARFRIILVDTLVGREDDAREVLQQARQRDASTPFLGLSLTFWDTYGMTADVRAACRRVTQEVRSDPEPVLRSLHNWDDRTAEPGPDDLCKVP